MLAMFHSPFTGADGTGGCLSAPRAGLDSGAALARSEIGSRSLIVKQMVHLKTLSSLVHRTCEPDVMQFPFA